MVMFRSSPNSTDLGGKENINVIKEKNAQNICQNEMETKENVHRTRKKLINEIHKQIKN